MANRVLESDKKFTINSIPDQHLTHANQLTIKSWNDIINILRLQTNNTTNHLKDLYEFLIGNTEDVSIPDEYSSFIQYLLDTLTKIYKNSLVIDALTSDSATAALSANQGRILNEKISKIQIGSGSDTSSIINLGTILSYNDLNLVTADGFYIYKAAFGQTNPDMCLMEVYHQQQYAIQVIYLFNHAFAKLVTRQQTLVNYELVWSDVIEHSLLKSTDVINNLSTDSSYKPLSALQGKILNNKFTKHTHCISVKYTDTTISLIILMNFANGASTVISNYNELTTAIYNAGFVSASKFLQVNGKAITIDGSFEYPIIGLYSDGSNLRFIYLVGIEHTARIIGESAIVSDNVI